MTAKERALSTIAQIDSKDPLKVDPESIVLIRAIYTASLVVYEGLMVVASVIKDKK